MRVGLIGSGWYGKTDLFHLMQVTPVEVVGLCDVDSQETANRATCCCMPGTYLFVQDVLAELKEEDPEGYGKIHFSYYDGLAHAFPPKEPAAGIDFIQQQRRDAFPEKLTWEYATTPFPRAEASDKTTRFVKRHFYWLRCDDPVDRQYVIATRKGNTFELELDGRDEEGLSILLNDSMIDPQKEVVVTIDGDEAYRGKPARTIRNVLESLDARVDRTLVFDRRISLGGD